MQLLLRNVEIDGQAPFDVLICGGRIAKIGTRLIGTRLGAAAQIIDGHGAALIPGLIDHHIHLFATAARADTVVLDDARGPEEVGERLRRATAERAAGSWVRAAGYHEHHCGPLDRARLDVLAPDHRVRVEHQSGSLWLLNSLALQTVATSDAPPCVERDVAGLPTGNIWRGERWLRERIGRNAPRFAPIGQSLAAMGVTSVMDASPTTDAESASILAGAHRLGELPQRIGLMSAGSMSSAFDEAVTVGPVKFLLDDHDLPDLDWLASAVAKAHEQRRCVAFHCVTYGELALALAAIDIAGPVAGDRIEHGSLIAGETVEDLRQKGLTVVVQPGFVRERGDRYLSEVDVDAQCDLYRCASLLQAGVPVVGSSDAPYGSMDPWAAMRASVVRTTCAGVLLGGEEAIQPQQALNLFLGHLHGRVDLPRSIVVGAPADLCLLKVPMRSALSELDARMVAVTVIGGKVVYASV
jgi:predicted amidohydrolase YtcJ